jgi:hypothetical protein
VTIKHLYVIFLDVEACTLMKSTDHLEQHIASIFKAKTSCLLTASSSTSVGVDIIGFEMMEFTSTHQETG